MPRIPCDPVRLRELRLLSDIRYKHNALQDAFQDAAKVAVEGMLRTDTEIIEVTRSPRPDLPLIRKRKGKPWVRLWGHAFKGIQGLAVTYYLTPNGNVCVCCRGGGHFGHLVIDRMWIEAEISRLKRLRKMLMKEADYASELVAYVNEP